VEKLVGALLGTDVTKKKRLYRVSQHVLDSCLQSGSEAKVGFKGNVLLFPFIFWSLPVPVNPEMNRKLALKG